MYILVSNLIENNSDNRVSPYWNELLHFTFFLHDECSNHFETFATFKLKFDTN